MIPATFEYLAPKSLREALSLLRKYGQEAKVLAGGHSLIPLMKLRLARPRYLIDLGRVPDLAYIREEEGELAIGPMTTYYMLESSPLVRSRLPLLAEAASLVADVQVRNKGTIGGSLAHADPAGDLPAVVLALGATIKAASFRRERSIKIEDFFVDMWTTALRPNEVLTQIRIPILPPRTGTAYKKFANKASHYAIVGVAAIINLDGQGRCQGAAIGITGAGPKAVRAREAEELLKGRHLDQALLQQAAERAGEGIDFLEDLHASAEYRAHLTRVYTRRALEEALGRAQAPV